MEFETTLREFAGAGRLRQIVAAELPQKDDLCGPFWALAAARLFGAGNVGNAGQDLAALAAGTRLWDGGDSLPPGISGRRDYTRPIPTTTDPLEAGTDRAGVTRAVHDLIGRPTEVIEITDPSRRWRTDALAAAVEVWSGAAEDGAAALDAADPIVVLANVATEHYLFPIVGEAHRRYLATGDTADYRPSDWSAGHFVAVLGWRDGPAGRLYRIHDSYPLDATLSTGCAAIHDQPCEAFSAALRRSGRSPGGLVIVCAPSDSGGIRRGCETVGWDWTRLDPRAVRRSQRPSA